MDLKGGPVVLVTEVVEDLGGEVVVVGWVGEGGGGWRGGVNEGCESGAGRGGGCCCGGGHCARILRSRDGFESLILRITSAMVLIHYHTLRFC